MFWITERYSVLCYKQDEWARRGEGQDEQARAEKQITDFYDQTDIKLWQSCIISNIWFTFPFNFMDALPKRAHWFWLFVFIQDDLTKLAFAVLSFIVDVVILHSILERKWTGKCYWSQQKVNDIQTLKSNCSEDEHDILS